MHAHLQTLFARGLALLLIVAIVTLGCEVELPQMPSSGVPQYQLAGLIPVHTVHGAEMPPVMGDDPSAKALAYVEASTKDGQTCDNCNFWQGGDAERGGCPLFPGKSVVAKGWCKSWVKKG